MMEKHGLCLFISRLGCAPVPGPGLDVETFVFVLLVLSFLIPTIKRNRK